MSWLLAGDRLLWCGDVTVPVSFFGLVYQTYPNGYPTTSPAPSVGYSIYRIHDHQGSDGNWVVWGNQNPSNGVYDWTQLDAIINPLYAQGKRVWYTLCGCPTWAAKPANQATAGLYGINGSFSAPNDMAYLSAFVTALMTRYRGKITYLEIWNEPAYDNSSSFFKGTATEMAQMARAVYQAAKAADPSVTVMSPSDWSASGYLVQFLNASDGAGGFGRQWFDAVTVHPYYRWWHTDVYLTPPYDIRIYMHALRLQLVAGGLSYDFPVHAGETGYASDRLATELTSSTPEQLARWAIRYAIGLSVTGVKSMVLYCYDTTNAGNPLSNAVVARAWDTINRVLPGKRLRAVHLTSNGLYRITTDNSGVFAI